MADKFLNKTGLSYFWEKIKGYVSDKAGIRLFKKAYSVSSKIRGYEGLCYANGMFFALSRNSVDTIPYSFDGMNWSEASLPGLKTWGPVVYGNGKFIIYGSSYNYGSAFAYSEDGISWTEGTSTAESFTYERGACYGNGKFIVNCYSSKAFYSEDGLSWTLLTSENTQNFPFGYSWIVYGNGVFVAKNINHISYSVDGLTWTEASYQCEEFFDVLCYGSGKFVILANNKALYSENGINWTEVDLPCEGEWMDIAYGDGRFVGIAKNSSKIVYSDDGIVWLEASLPYSIAEDDSTISHGAGKFVILNDGGRNVIISEDGLNWIDATYQLVDVEDTDVTSDVAEALGVPDKQDKLTGSQGQFVGFTADNVVGAVDAPAGTMIVNVTESGGSVTADKTVAEIQEAVSKGMTVIACVNDMLYMPLVKIQDGVVAFTVVTEDGEFVGAYYSDSATVTAGNVQIPFKASKLPFDKLGTGLNSGNVQAAIEEVNEKIPAKPIYRTVTLPASGWSSNTKTVTVPGVLADETAQLIQPMPASASQAAYYVAGILCTNQAANSLTFTCQTVPTEDLTVYVVIQEVTA